MNVVKNNESICIYCFKKTEKLKSQICVECISCKGKEIFSSRNIAESVLRWYSSDGKSLNITSYQCKFCGKYHLGHSNYQPFAS